MTTLLIALWSTLVVLSAAYLKVKGENRLLKKVICSLMAERVAPPDWREQLKRQNDELARMIAKDEFERTSG